MKDNQLNKILSNKNLLKDVSYKHLTNLVALYPYCQNLRILSLEKSKMDNDENLANKNLITASVYCSNRTILHKKMLLIEKTEPHVVPEVKEPTVSKISIIDKILQNEGENENNDENIVISWSGESNIEQQNESPNYTTNLEDLIEEEANENNFVAVNNNSTPSEPINEEININNNDDDEIIEDEVIIHTNLPLPSESPITPKKLTPIQTSVEPKEISSSELKAKDATIDILISKVKALENELKKLTSNKKKKQKKDPTVIKANSYLKKNENIVTETLAKLYDKQGHFSKSIKIYKQLTLFFPEKSGYFADKIKDLNKKIENQ